jgi:nicotinic acid mononucleotide adenylyltransferase
MLIGEDMLDHLAGWPDVESLASNITFIVGLRRKTKAEVRQLLDTIHATRGLAITAYVFQEPVSDASSTHARSQLRNGLLPRTVSPAVKNYIKQHRLYRPYKSAAKS